MRSQQLCIERYVHKICDIRLSPLLSRQPMLRNNTLMPWSLTNAIVSSISIVTPRCAGHHHSLCLLVSTAFFVRSVKYSSVLDHRYGKNASNTVHFCALLLNFFLFFDTFSFFLFERLEKETILIVCYAIVQFSFFIY